MKSNTQFKSHFGDDYFQKVTVLKAGKPVPGSLRSNEIILQAQASGGNFIVCWKENDQILSRKIARDALYEFEHLLRPGKSKNQALISTIVEQAGIYRDDREEITEFKKRLAQISCGAGAELNSERNVVIGMSPDLVYTNMIHQLELVFANENMNHIFPISWKLSKNKTRTQFVQLVHQQLNEFTQLAGHNELLEEYDAHKHSQEFERGETIIDNWKNAQAEVEDRNNLIQKVVSEHQILSPNRISTMAKDSYRSRMKAYHACDASHLDAEIYREAASYKAALDIINDDWRSFHKKEYLAMAPLYQVQAECEPQGNLDSGKSAKNKVLAARQMESRENGRKKSGTRFFLSDSEQQKVAEKFTQSQSLDGLDYSIRLSVDEFNRSLDALKNKAATLSNEQDIDECHKKRLTDIAQLSFDDEDDLREFLTIPLADLKKVNKNEFYQLMSDLHKLISSYFHSQKRVAKQVHWRNDELGVEISEKRNRMFASINYMENKFRERIESSSISIIT